MRRFNIYYDAKVSVVVEAATENQAINEAQRITLQIAKKDRVFLEPKNSRMGVEELKA
jgi:hypothetical protein